MAATRKAQVVEDDLPPVDDFDHEGVATDAGQDFLGTIDIMDGIPDGMVDALARTGVSSAGDDNFDYRRQSPMEEATPADRPGYKNRWVRIIGPDGKPDVGNKSRALADGYRPRLASTLLPGETAPVYKANGYPGGVIVWREQMLLMEIPLETLKVLNGRLSREADAINNVIYNQVSKSGLNSKYASIGVDGVPAGDLVDN